MKQQISRAFRQDFPEFAARAEALGVRISLSTGPRKGHARVYWLDGYRQLTGYTTRCDGSPFRHEDAVRNIDKVLTEIEEDRRAVVAAAEALNARPIEKVAIPTTWFSPEECDLLDPSSPPPRVSALRAAGYAVVPREPTQAMLAAAKAVQEAQADAFWASEMVSDGTGIVEYRSEDDAEIYRAMVAAAEALNARPIEKVAIPTTWLSPEECDLLDPSSPPPRVSLSWRSAQDGRVEYTLAGRFEHGAEYVLVSRATENQPKTARERRVKMLAAFPCESCGKPITKDDDVQWYDDECVRCRDCADSLTRAAEGRGDG